jgi:hypothetical protein
MSESAALLLLFMLAVCLWLPFGLRFTGITEEWGNYAALTFGKPIVPNPVAERANRPFENLPALLGYLAAPDSFVGLNLVHLGLFAGKACLAYVLIRHLAPAWPGLALLFGALSLTFPGDTALLCKRSMAGHLVLLAFLAAATLLVRIHRHFVLAEAIALWLCLAIAMGTSEIVLPLALAFPVVLFWTGRRPVAAWLRSTLVWYPLPLAAAAVLAVSLRSDSYQAQKLVHVDSTAVAASFWRVCRRLLGDAWIESAGAFSWHSGIAWLAIGMALPMAGACWLLARKSGETIQPGVRAAARMVAAGFGVMALGFAPYALTLYRNENFTTLYAASLGGALCVAGVVLALAPIAGRWWPALAVVPLVLANFSTLGNQAEFVAWSRQQQSVLATISSDAGGQFLDGTLVILIGDQSVPRADQRYDPRFPFFPGAAFRDSMRYLYEQPWLFAWLCEPYLAHQEGWYTESCHLDRHGVVIRSPWMRTIASPWSRVVAFHYDAASGSTTRLDEIPLRYMADVERPIGYLPRLRIDAAAPPPRRASTALEQLRSAPAGSTPPALESDVLVDFAGEVTGVGWEALSARAGGPGPAGAHAAGPLPEEWPDDGRRLWTRETTATLYLPVRLQDSRLEFRVVHFLDPAILDSLRVSVDRTPIEVQRRPDPRGGLRFSAFVPGAAMIDDDGAVVELTVDRLTSPQQMGVGADRRQLGLLLDWVHLYPATANR